MTRAGRQAGRAAVCVLGLVVGVAASLPVTAQGTDPSGTGGPAPRVVVVSIPALGFDDVTPADTPELVALADRGATAALSVKTIGRHTDRPGGYATLGAGARALAPSGTSAGAIGAEGAGPVGVSGLSEVRRANAGTHQGAVIGALGIALHRAGRATAIVANHDGSDGVDRSAALGVVRPRPDPDDGLVDLGTVQRDLTTTDADGRRGTDPEAVLAALEGVDRARASGTVTLVEIGDVAWAEGDGSAPSSRTDAVRRADALLGRITERLGPSDVVLVLAPTAPADREQPTPFVLVGPDVDPGAARSATTRRGGYVTLTDVAPTILDAVDVDVPASMAGTPIRSERSSASGASRLADLRDQAAEHRFVDRASGIFLVTLPIVFACWALLALLVTVLPLGRATTPARTAVRWVGLSLACTPIVTYLLGAVTVRGWGQPAWSAVVWSLGAAGGAVAVRVRRPGRAAVGIAGLVWLVLVGDLLLGGSLQFGTALGNSPTVAGRFAGIGNNAFGLLAAATLVLAVAGWRWTAQVRTGPAVAGAVFAVALVVDGAPSLGSDVGGVLVLGPVAALTLWALAGRGVSWGRVALAGLGTLAVLGVLTAIDLARPESSQTHLGRLARGLTGGGGGSADVIRRKADAALHSVVNSSLVWLVVCTVLLAALLWAFDRADLRAACRPPLARTLLASGSAMAVLGAALNDSGVMVPAMMATVLVPTAFHLYLADPLDDGSAGASAGPSPDADRPAGASAR